MSTSADMPQQGKGVDNPQEHLGPKAAEQHPFISEVLSRQEAPDRPFVPLTDKQFATGLRQIEQADLHALFRDPAKLHNFHLNLNDLADTAKASNDPTMLRSLIERIDAHSLVVSKHIEGSTDRGTIVGGLQNQLDTLQPKVDKDLSIPTS